MRVSLQLNQELPLRNGWASVDHIHGVVDGDWSVRADFDAKPDANGHVTATLFTLTPEAIIPETFEIQLGRFVAATGTKI